MFFAVAAVPFVFGLSLWFLASGLESDFGALQGRFYTVILWMAAGFAVVSVLVVGSQTWLARARLREFISIQFGRVLPVMVIPNTSLVFALILSFLVLGRLSDFVASSAPLSDDAAGRLVLVLQVFALSALANPLAIGLSLRVRDILTTQGFTRMMTFAEIASFPSILALVWGFLQLGSV